MSNLYRRSSIDASYQVFVEMKTRMYINIAKPASLPELKRYKTRMYVNIAKVK
jgi:hypothetical protein